MRFAPNHEYARVEGDVAIVGISEFAADEMGDIVAVTFPEIGKQLAQGEPFGLIESSKIVQEIYAPVGGTVIEVNPILVKEPTRINDDAEGSGWIIKIEMANPADLDNLADEDSF